MTDKEFEELYESYQFPCEEFSTEDMVGMFMLLLTGVVLTLLFIL